MHELSELIEALDLQQIADNRFRAKNAGGGRDVIFGGQMLGQEIVAAHRTQPQKEVKTVHTIFARGGMVTEDTELEVDTMHNGRTFGSVSVTTWQGKRLIARSQVLMHAVEPDLMRHADPMPKVETPDIVPIREYEFTGYEMGVIGGINVSDPDVVAPPDLDVWIRFKGSPDDVLTSQCLLAYSTDGFLIGTSMLPHKGIGMGQAHSGISTGVVSHTLTFHEPFKASEWMLLDQHVPYAGRGRIYGQANVFKQDGTLIASFVQDSMVRHFPEGQSSAGREGSVF